MGLFDKIETGLKNVDSKASQKIDEAKIDVEVRKRKSEIEKIKTEIGETYYKGRKGGKPSLESEMNSLYDKIIALENEIKDLEEEKDRVIAEAKAEREANRRASG
ncbi:MAG: hypothetical protein GX224_02480 [Thermoplasmatales archaeon]|nr:hypothetical protein [Thermoplasmatales archaeon]